MTQLLTIESLYANYLQLLKRMFGFSLRPKRLDYEELEEAAHETYTYKFTNIEQTLSKAASPNPVLLSS